MNASGELFPEMPNSQRWRAGRESYRPAGEPIDPTRYFVEPVCAEPARRFIEANHYAKSMPPARFRAGLFRRCAFHKPELVGVAVYSVPIQRAALNRYLGVAEHEGIELGRLCLLDSVEANGESFFTAKANRLLHKSLPAIKACLSYSDPVPRATANGELVKRGHVGCVYRALSARFFGRSRRRTLILAPDGTVLSERTLSKLRNDERGAAGAYRMLLGYGAPRRLPFEDGAQYVMRALREAQWRFMNHPGNYVFGWPIGARTTRPVVARHMARALDYPPYSDYSG